MGPFFYWQRAQSARHGVMKRAGEEERGRWGGSMNEFYPISTVFY